MAERERRRKKRSIKAGLPDVSARGFVDCQLQRHDGLVTKDSQGAAIVCHYFWTEIWILRILISRMLVNTFHDIVRKAAIQIREIGCGKRQ